jgi:hypothetical protein
VIDVDEVDPDRVLAQPDLALARRRQFDLLVAHDFGTAGLMYAYRAHAISSDRSLLIVIDDGRPAVMRQPSRCFARYGLPAPTADLIASRRSGRTGF